VFHLGHNSQPLEVVPAEGQPPARLGGLICFELIYPELAARHRERGATLLVNSSNLGWFHGNRLLWRQFLAIGQIRAAENRMPLVISANTGVSALISSRGRILQQSASDERGVLLMP
jgi:apolipoprotein N-acyltransferase